MKLLATVDPSEVPRRGSDGLTPPSLHGHSVVYNQPVARQFRPKCAALGVIAVQTRVFSDFDAFTDSVRGVDSTMMLQNPTRRSWVISHLDLPEIHLQLGRLGSGNIVEGQSWPPGYVLYLPLTEACPYKANGAILRPGSLMILEPGCEFSLSTQFGHDWCSIFVPTHKDSCTNKLDKS